MLFKSVAITGGAGFVGSNLALNFRQRWPDLAVFAVDNLRRRGSELSLPRLRLGRCSLRPCGRAQP